MVSFSAAPDGPAGARAEGILDAACTPGSKFIVKDYADRPANTQPRGHDMAAYVKAKNAAGVDTEYMLLVWAVDSGKPGGGFAFYSWDNPGVWSPPVERFTYPASQLREAHSTPLTNMVGGHWSTFVAEATTGFSVYDLSSAAAPLLKKNFLIAGLANGGKGSAALCGASCGTSYDAGPRDYSLGGVWYISVQAPYIFVGQTDNGLNIFKFTDPNDASKIAWVKRLDASWFGHRVNSVWAMGNLLVAAASEAVYGVDVLDIGNPENPVKLHHYDLTTPTVTRNAYSWTLNGTHLYEAMKPKTGLNKNGLGVYSLNPVDLSLTWQGQYVGTCSSGGYTAIQDGFAHIGLSSCYQKVDLATLKAVTPRSPPYSIGITGADNDFVTPFGSAVFLGNDHNAEPGSAVLCHQAAADTRPPAVNGQMPRSGATGAKVTTGVGVSFTDNLKEWTISTASLPVRQQGSITAVPGYYSYQLNIVNFRPATRFDAGTTYQVAVTAGVQDLAGNGATPYTGSFTTASAVSQALFDDPDHTAWSVADNLQEGDPAYGDSAATIAGVPDLLRGRTWIRPASGSRTVAADAPVVDLELAEPAGLYVCADTRGPLPAWLDGWTDSGLTLSLTDGAASWPMACYARTFPPGPVSLGGAGGAPSQYVVALGPPTGAGAAFAEAAPHGGSVTR